MDSRSAVQPLENNQALITISRPSTSSEQADQKLYEFRAVETIEEFFRPQITKDDMTSQIYNTDLEGAESFEVPGANTTQKTFNEPPKIRMGFPNMSYLNPDLKG